MILGVTGTRNQPSDRQVRLLRERIMDPSVNVVHHGDCQGVDALAGGFACKFGKNIVVHPPISDSLRAYAHIACPECRWRRLVLDEQPYLVRDRSLVAVVDELVALPSTLAPVPHSGTWYTINYAKKVGRKVNIIYP